MEKTEAVVWFADNFKSVSRLVPGLRRTMEAYGSRFGRLKIAVSSPKEDFAGFEGADFALREPASAEGEEYGRWVLETAEAIGADFIIPGRRRRQLSRLKGELAKLPRRPVLLECASGEILKGLDDKAWTMAKLESLGLGDLAGPWRLARCAAGLKEGLDWIGSLGYRRACFKPVTGIYGQGFRFVSPVPAKDPGSSLGHTPPHRISMAQALELAGREKEMKAQICMPMMRGPEISADCFAQGGELVGFCAREKRGRTQRAGLCPQAREACGRIARAFGFSGFFNAQFRHDTKTGQLRLLEINPRLAGGVSYGQISGFDLVYWSLAHMRGLCAPGDFPAVEDGKIISVKASRIGQKIPPMFCGADLGSA